MIMDDSSSTLFSHHVCASVTLQSQCPGYRSSIAWLHALIFSEMRIKRCRSNSSRSAFVRGSIRQFLETLASWLEEVGEEERKRVTIASKEWWGLLSSSPQYYDVVLLFSE